jgi:hypothetical protein
VATVVRRIVYDVAGREANAKQNDETEHRGEKRMQFALRNGLLGGSGQCIGSQCIGSQSVDDLRAHELNPLCGLGVDGESSGTRSLSWSTAQSNEL